MSEIADFGNEKIVLLSLNVSVKNLDNGTPFNGKETVIKCMQKFWALDAARANCANYVIGIYESKVYSVAKLVKPWKYLPVAVKEGYLKDCPNLEKELQRNIANGKGYFEPNFPKINLLERYACVADIVDKSHPLAKQIGKKVPQKYRFYGNVVKFVNI